MCGCRKNKMTRMTSVQAAQAASGSSDQAVVKEAEQIAKDASSQPASSSR